MSTPTFNGYATAIPAAVDLSKLGVFNVMEYGAKGDGTTDDTTAIQNALNAANTAGGGEVLFPRPSVAYLCSTGLQLYSNLTLRGIDMAEIRMTTTWITSSTVPGPIADRMLSTKNDGTAYSNISIVGLTLNGNQTATYENGYGIGFSTVTTGKIIDCEIKSLGGEGILLENATGIQVERNYIHNTNHGVNAFSNSSKCNIVFNRLDVRGFAVYLEGGNTRMKVAFNNCAPIGGGSGLSGIVVANDSVGLGTVMDSIDILSNVVDMSAVTAGSYGIFVSATVANITNLNAISNHILNAAYDGFNISESGGFQVQRCNFSHNTIESCNTASAGFGGATLTSGSNSNIAIGNRIHDANAKMAYAIKGGLEQIGNYSTGISSPWALDSGVTVTRGNSPKPAVSSPAYPASGVNVTNSFGVAVLVALAGSYSNVVVNSQGVGASSGGMLQYVPANGVIQLTYSAGGSWGWIAAE